LGKTFFLIGIQFFICCRELDLSDGKKERRFITRHEDIEPAVNAIKTIKDAFEAIKRIRCSIPVLITNEEAIRAKARITAMAKSLT
jgi:hypothetical protein